jgi:hypothetical protein
MLGDRREQKDVALGVLSPCNAPGKEELLHWAGAQPFVAPATKGRPEFGHLDVGSGVLAQRCVSYSRSVRSVRSVRLVWLVRPVFTGRWGLEPGRRVRYGSA